MSDLHDDISAAFSSVESGTPAPSSTPAPAAPAAPAAPTNLPRDPAGRFQSPSTAVPAAPGGPQAAPATAVPTPTPSGQPAPAPAALGGPAAPAAPGVPGQIALDPSKPPQGWRPEMKEKWASLPEDIRGEVIRREEASAQGVARLREYYEPMEELFNGLTIFDDYFEQIERDPIEYLQDVIRMEQTLTTGNPAQKMQTLLDLGDMYGVPLRQVLDTAMGGSLNQLMQQSHQHHKTPAQIPLEVQNELHALRSQQSQLVEYQAEAELDHFLSVPRPFFEEVADDMEMLLDNEVCSSYQEAYDMAVWRNPATRQRAQGMMNHQQQATALQQRQAAAGVISTPAPAAITTPSNAAGEQTTEDAVRAAWNQAARGGGVG